MTAAAAASPYPRANPVTPRYTRASSPPPSARKPTVGAAWPHDAMGDHPPTVPASYAASRCAGAPTVSQAFAPAVPSVISTVDAKGKSALVKTYGYTAAGLGISGAAGAIAAAAFPPLGGLGMGLAFAASIGSMFGALGRAPSQSLAKHACWLGFTVSMGVMMSPLAVVGAPILAQAAMLTTGVAAALTGTAMLMPAGSFQSWRGPLTGALAGLVGVGLITLCMPASWAIVQASHQLSLWGGLAVFTGFMLADTNGICDRANHPQFDAMHESMDIYLNLVNLFVRFVDLLQQTR